MTGIDGRRRFLQLGLGAFGGVLLPARARAALAASCGPETPAQTAGPFYPGEPAFQPDWDLTQVRGRKAKGQVVWVRGRVLDPQCRPVVGATVEIWQACASGRYNNAKDPNPAPLDPDFKYWGESITDEQGGYLFKTVVPGAYPADEGWVRPPHVHFKVARLGFRELVTQMYFKGEPLNADDLILNDLAARERDSVIVEFSPSQLEAGTLEGAFDIVLHPVRAARSRI